jgi:NADPH:quinone reductase-like Zn-dependent oxidoreductase
MKAVMHKKGRPPRTEVVEMEKPAPQDDQVLIKVCAASVNPLDLFRKSDVEPSGVDVAGQVEAVGKNVKQFKVGDEVFGGCKASFAEYGCASEAKIAIKPGNVSFEQAASVPIAALTALQGLRDKGKIRAGQKVLVNGASGGVGTFAVQIAKAFGAEVTGACSTRNVEMVRGIGADHVVDYTTQEFTRSGERYDLIFDLAANHSLLACRRALTPKGILVLGGIIGVPGVKRKIRTFLFRAAVAAPVLSLLVSQGFVAFIAKIKQEDLITMGGLLASGKVKPVIDRRYRLDDVAEAMEYLAAGHARGKVVVNVS